MCGFNYVPGYAVNSTDQWQAASFDLARIKSELEWARDIGFNACRVFLPFLVWEADPDGLLERMEAFLEVAARCGLKTLPILFDDCAFAGKEPYLGRQEEAIPGVHNSGWTPSPGPTRALDPASWSGLRDYVLSVVGRFGQDARIVAWDVYNESGNSEAGTKILPLLREAFAWVRECEPVQPLTGAYWSPEQDEINAFLLGSSDLISFHDYEPLDKTTSLVEKLVALERPLWCTEWMRRDNQNRFESHLPFFQSQNIGCFFWGLVNGATQTHFPWNSPPHAPAPQLWFHDLLRSDGKPHIPEEVALIRSLLSTAS